MERIAYVKKYKEFKKKQLEKKDFVFFGNGKGVVVNYDKKYNMNIINSKKFCKLFNYDISKYHIYVELYKDLYDAYPQFKHLINLK